MQIAFYLFPTFQNAECLVHAKCEQKSCFQINVLLKFAKMIKNNVSNRQATKLHQLHQYLGGYSPISAI